MLWRRRIEPFARPFFQAYSRMSRGATLGVRGLVLDGEGRVLLVEHTYIHGWHMPGGGVERGETTEQAMAKELREEAGVEIIGRPRLLSIHDNGRHFPGDHVLLYRVDHWRPVPSTQRGEISRIGFFAPDDLPEGTTRATRARIKEALEGVEADLMW
jgi:8-oxo-dGTP pyrophosphatase MutT (NUDIX family)